MPIRPMGTLKRIAVASQSIDLDFLVPIPDINSDRDWDRLHCRTW